MKKIFHILPNAHLDPVWFWNQHEGLNEGVKTCSTIVKLMDRFPELTFNRGEAAIYNHIQKTDPGLFARIKELMAAGRWCAVGGGWIQPDQNMPSTVDFLRQFTIGREYFKQELGIEPLVAWAADPFGHSEGMPEIYAASGFKYFSFTRPNNHLFPLKDDVFRWVGNGGSSILSARFNSNWYGCERPAVIPELDGALERVKDRKRVNIAMGFGLGDHGGGPTARQVEDLMAWREQHPEVEVRFSTFDAFFAALEEEIAEGLEIKHEFRKSSNLLRRAENSVRIINDYLASPTAGTPSLPPAPNFTEAWRSMLFNCFHDIIPGSAIESALFEQREELGGVAYTARRAEFEAVNRLCAKVAVKVPAVEGDMPEAVPYIVFNPSPRPYNGFVELEVSLDYRPLWGVTHADQIVPDRRTARRGRQARPLPGAPYGAPLHAGLRLAEAARLPREDSGLRMGRLYSGLRQATAARAALRRPSRHRRRLLHLQRSRLLQSRSGRIQYDRHHARRQDAAHLHRAL